MTLLLDASSMLYTGRILPLLAYIGLTVMAFFALSRNPSNRLNQLFAALFLTASGWNIAFYFLLGASSAGDALFLWKIYELSVIALVPTLVYFTLRFAGRKASPLLVYTPSLIFLPFFLFTDLMYSGVYHVGIFYLPVTGSPLILLYNLYILTYILYALRELYTVHSMVDAGQKEKVKWMAAGIGAAIIVGSVDTVLSLAGIPHIPLSPPSTLLTVIFMSRGFLAMEGGL